MLNYLNKFLLGLWSMFMWLVFPPAFYYIIKDSKTLKKPYKTAAYVSLIISPGTIIILVFIIGLIKSIIPDNYPVKDLEKNINIQLTGDYDVISNNIKHQGQDFTATVEIKLSDECLKSTVQQIEKSKFFNLKNTYCVSENIKERERDTVLYWKVRNYLEKEHLTGYWIKQNDSMYKFYTPNLSDIPNAAILFNEAYDVDANLNVNNKVLEYKYFKY